MWASMHRSRAAVHGNPARLHGIPSAIASAVRFASGRASTELGGREVVLESGKLGPLADAAIFATYGNTSVLATAVSSSSQSPVPLSVEYRERASAFGVIPSTPTRKESGNSDRETLGSRLIDRTIRPLFKKGVVNDTQVTIDLISYDRDCDPAVISLLAASAALHVSPMHWVGPAAGVKVAWINGQPVLCPTAAQQAASQLDMLYAGAGTGSDHVTLMIEAEGKELPERDVITAMRVAAAGLAPLLEVQHKLFASIDRNVSYDLLTSKYGDHRLCLPSADLQKAVNDAIFEEAKDEYRIASKTKKKERSKLQARLQNKAIAAVSSTFAAEGEKRIGMAAEAAVRQAMRAVVLEAAAKEPLASPGGTGGNVLTTASELTYALRDIPSGRVDGRGSRQLRPLTAKVDVVPRVHGSALFARGATEVLATTTLGPIDLAADVEPAVTAWPGQNGDGGSNGGGDASEGGGSGATTIQPSHMFPDPSSSKRFFLHYDFPPYATNEVGKVGGPNRRSTGHGALAEKALRAVMPSEREFPYAIRVNATTTGSDGSSSMATVCSSTLALMDAGVPIKTPVAGISIGCMAPALEAGCKGAGMVRKSTAQPTSAPITTTNDAVVTDDSPDAAVSAAGSTYVLLTDILGLEDHAGDMDFKVAGTKDGVTAIQLDVKPAGLPLEVLEQAVWRAQAARGQLLQTMVNAIGTPRPTVKATAPLVEVLDLPAELRPKLIGPAGANMRRVERLSGARMVLDDESSKMYLYAPATCMATAKALIFSTVQEHLRTTGSPMSEHLQPVKLPELVVGVPVVCQVLRVIEFGAVLGIDGSEVGWLHVSELTNTRASAVADYVEEGDSITVMVTDVDARGRGRMSVKALLRPGEDTSKYITKAGKARSKRAPSNDAVIESLPASTAATSTSPVAPPSSTTTVASSASVASSKPAGQPSSTATAASSPAIASSKPAGQPSSSATAASSPAIASNKPAGQSSTIASTATSKTKTTKAASKPSASTTRKESVSPPSESDAGTTTAAAVGTVERSPERGAALQGHPPNLPYGTIVTGTVTKVVEAGCIVLLDEKFNTVDQSASAPSPTPATASSHSPFLFRGELGATGMNSAAVNKLMKNMVSVGDRITAVVGPVPQIVKKRSEAYHAEYESEMKASGGKSGSEDELKRRQLAAAATWQLHVLSRAHVLKAAGMDVTADVTCVITKANKEAAAAVAVAEPAPVQGAAKAQQSVADKAQPPSGTNSVSVDGAPSTSHAVPSSQEADRSSSDISSSSSTSGSAVTVPTPPVPVGTIIRGTVKVVVGPGILVTGFDGASPDLTIYLPRSEIAPKNPSVRLSDFVSVGDKVTAVLMPMSPDKIKRKIAALDKIINNPANEWMVGKTSPLKTWSKAKVRAFWTYRNLQFDVDSNAKSPWLLGIGTQAAELERSGIAAIDAITKSDGTPIRIPQTPTTSTISEQPGASTTAATDTSAVADASTSIAAALPDALDVILNYKFDFGQDDAADGVDTARGTLPSAIDHGAPSELDASTTTTTIPVDDSDAPSHATPAVDTSAGTTAADDSTATGARRDWQSVFDEVRKFVQANTHAPRTTASVDDKERRLGKWLANARYFQREGKLPEAKASLIAELLGPDWAVKTKAGPKRSRAAADVDE